MFRDYTGMMTRSGLFWTRRTWWTTRSALEKLIRIRHQQYLQALMRVYGALMWSLGKVLSPAKLVVNNLNAERFSFYLLTNFDFSRYSALLRWQECILAVSGTSHSGWSNESFFWLLKTETSSKNSDVKHHGRENCEVKWCFILFKIWRESTAVRSRGAGPLCGPTITSQVRETMPGSFEVEFCIEALSDESIGHV